MTKQLHQEHNRTCNKAKRRAGLSVHITSEHQHRQEVKPRENRKQPYRTPIEETGEAIIKNSRQSVQRISQQQPRYFKIKKEM